MVTNNTEVVKDLYVTVMASVLHSAVLIGTMLVAMFLLDWRLTSISLVLFLVMWLYSNITVRQSCGECAPMSPISMIVSKVIKGMGVIQ